MEIAEKIYQLNFIEKNNVKDTCKLADIGEKRFYKIMSEHGWETRKSNIDKKKARLYTNKGWLYEQYVLLGKTCKQIADEIKVGETTINNWLGKHNIEARTRSEIHSGKVVSEETREKLSLSHIGLLVGDKTLIGKVEQLPSRLVKTII